MKTVAIVGFLTPYVQGGSFRVLPLAKHLSQYGWEAIVISPDPQVELPFDRQHLFQSRTFRR